MIAAKIADNSHSLHISHCRRSGAQCHPMQKIMFFLLVCFVASFPKVASADAIQEVVSRHARTQSQGLPGEINIEVEKLDPQTRLPACTSLEAYTPPNARPWGKTYIGVRCLSPSTWQILVPVKISVTNNYIVTARALSAGQTLQTEDMAVLRGDLATLPTGVITDITKAAGKTLKNSLAANQPLRSDLLLAPLLIRQGQSVKLISHGTNFTVSSEGKALNNASEGQVVQIRVATGKVISGIVQADGSVEVNR